MTIKYENSCAPPCKSFIIFALNMKDIDHDNAGPALHLSAVGVIRLLRSTPNYCDFTKGNIFGVSKGSFRTISKTRYRAYERAMLIAAAPAKN